MNLHYPHAYTKSPQDLVPNGRRKVMCTKKKGKVLRSHHSTSPNKRLPPKPTLNILPTKVNLHILLALSIRVNRAHQALCPLQRALVALLRFLAHEPDQIARRHGALAFGIAEMLLDAAAQRVDALAHFLGVVVVGQEVAAGFAGGGGARGDGGGVAWVGGELGFERVEEVLVISLAVTILLG